MVAHIGIGSNIGNRHENCSKAIKILEEKGLRVKKISSLYETEPWGVKEQPKFINLVIEVETDYSPYELMNILKETENALGRVKTTKWGPRVIDLDILFYESEIINTEELVIPHPYLQEREFVLDPLEEISPHKMHPVLKKTVRDLKEELKNAKNIKCKE
ncbi:MAG: 2-amino-4-hydroxy-6-hydroxymethyldihydropteridine diphosphokinase [Thermodesulfovibrionales bacterium]|nr:2-amino-4-hydroxy-6-hydroxymethyldihydropteridine diphosphokinase [Thermodesulfovibrionales bacterium]